MKKILITGAAGQLGSEIKYLVNQNLYPDLEFIFTDVDELDITHLPALNEFFQMHTIDFIVNCAAYTAVDKAEADRQNAELVNEIAPRNLAQISHQFKVPVIHVSTDYVFDGKKSTPYTEEDETNPVTVYGITKLNGERAIKDAYKYIVIRTSWLYSKFGHNFVKTMLRFSKEKNNVNVVNDQKGSPTNAADLADAIMQIIVMSAENPEKFIQGTYHFSDEGTCTWYEFAVDIMAMAGSECKVNPVSSDQFPSVAKRPDYSLMDITKIKQIFDIRIPHWKESLRKFMDVYTG